MCLCEYSLSTRLASHPCLPPFISGVSMILPDLLARLESIGGGPGVGLGAALQKPTSPQDFAGNQTLVW